jgi:hypothetical protein
MDMKFTKLLTFAGVAALCLASVTAQATALVRISPTGVPSTSTTIATDPVPIGATGFRLTYHSQGNQPTILDPLVLIFATPQGGLSAAPPLSASSLSNPGGLVDTITLGGTNVYGGSWDPTTGYAGIFDNSGSGKVYQDIGLDTAGSASQNYSNWNGESGDTAWDLWVYTITFDPNLESGYWAEFNTNLPEHTFVAGYGCTAIDPTNGLCDTQSSTPFTWTGYVTDIPEPSILALLSIGLLGLAGARRYKA